MPRGALLRCAAAVLVAAAAGVVAPAAPASAATCATADGVVVVVDFHQLGGGLRQSCDPSGGGHSAARLFGDAGFSLTRVQTQPGFVCRVNGLPASDPCHSTPPADAYWALWWADATSGSWRYATMGVDSLDIPRGGYVALSWSTGSTAARPGVAPTRQVAAPAPSPTASPSPTSTPARESAPATQSASSEPTAPASTAQVTTKRKGHSTPSASTSAAPSAPMSPAVTAATAPAAADVADSDRLPAWVGPLGIASLFAVAGASVLLRRRGAGARR